MKAFSGRVLRQLPLGLLYGFSGTVGFLLGFYAAHGHFPR